MKTEQNCHLTSGKVLCQKVNQLSLTSLHLKQMAGTNSHHIVEGAFKAFARAMRQAVVIEDATGAVPSTKGVLE